jgi:hypothetical protein
MLQSLHPRAMTSAGLTSPILTPAYVTNNNFSGTSSNMLSNSQQFHQSISPPYGYTSFSNGPLTTILPTYSTNRIQQRALPRLIPRGFITETQSLNPSIKPEKPELIYKAPRSSESYISSIPEARKTISSNIRIDGTTEAEFGTEVDILMKMIQSKTQVSSAQPDSSFSFENQNMPLVSTLCILPSFQSSIYRSKHKASSQQSLYLGNFRKKKILQRSVRNDFDAL